MTIEELIEFRTRRPFQPFQVVLRTGESIEILKQTSIGFGKTQVHMFYPDLRRHRMVHIDEIAAAKPLEPPQLLDRITIRPGQLGGKPCIRGMRIPVSHVLGLLANGLTSEQILKQFPDLEQDDIHAALAYAARELT
jgi:uncharacterized protein (DUF433 family)